ncbi:MAG: 16S rRNA (adenine(1518)-N(6)/adenine(1519)-N(6))-dimethyltransferase RsmA [Candidatus Diapherotrites archaeon]|nr:16S rRNA (adenine(1518)-N(6)/adenine(1519)-N(6))-dimethyltransferase RsmA [Candidatus Diapherotrites archaeon]
MKDLFEELQLLMQKYRFKPSKKLSQNFLVSRQFIERIVLAAELKDKDIVLEIGCGTGFLTREILKHCSVVGFETDEILQKVLEAEIAAKNFRLFKQDFLKAELPEFSKIVSSPPYNISSDIMHSLFKLDFESGVLLFEKAFVEKITSLPGFRDYCATAVLTQYFFETTIIGEVPSDAFFPQPKTTSQIIGLEKSKKHGIAENDLLFEQFVEQLFRYKNKNLGNALNYTEDWVKAKLRTPNKALEDFLESSELAGVKVYLIEVEEFVKVFNQLCNA